MSKSFQDLRVWRLSMDLTILIYKLTSTFPDHERYGLISQMRRSAVSISSNIAEGAGRETRRDFRQFVIIARGSNCELHTQLLVAIRLGYCDASQMHEVEQMLMEVGRMLNGLAGCLKVTATAKPNHLH